MPETPPDTAVGLVQHLLKVAKMTPLDISVALGGRVSSRTIYRWSKGESAPQNKSDFEALEKLVAEKHDAK